MSNPAGSAPYSFSTVAIDVEPVTEQTFLPFEVVRTLDAVVVRGDQELLTGDVVRTGLAHDLTAFVVIE